MVDTRKDQASIASEQRRSSTWALQTIISALLIIVGAVAALSEIIQWHAVIVQFVQLYDGWIRQPLLWPFRTLGWTLPTWAPDALIIYNGFYLALWQTMKDVRGRAPTPLYPADFKRFGWKSMTFVTGLIYLIMPAYYLVVAYTPGGRAMLFLAGRYVALMLTIILLIILLNNMILSLPAPSMSRL